MTRSLLVEEGNVVGHGFFLILVIKYLITRCLFGKGKKGYETETSEKDI
jgi:hypothetical protein